MSVRMVGRPEGLGLEYTVVSPSRGAHGQFTGGNR
jgi:hypothetical protein